ncbi:phage head closure protein [Hyphococcus sp.]|jgi:SPP1 family predicted phage head-tail adaptor|uniref:phage head closure protein n=1 Tax=Hyphococcus sp. TaxID=2038636 RepID=UPI003D119B28
MIGALRHKIVLLDASRDSDEAGGASLSWAPGAEIWASVERLASTRDFAGDRENRLKRIAVTIRFSANVSLGQRLTFEGETYETVSIESDDGRDRRLTLICEEVLS